MKKRKTRQQKIIAKLKRQLKSTQVESVPTQPKQTVSSPKAEYTPKPELELKEDKLITHPQLIKKDLAKTAFLSSLIICFELVIYLFIR